jgi:hypothetical protein
VRDFSITGFGTTKMEISQFPWDLLVGFVTQKSRLKIPSKHIEFQKSSRAGILFFKGAQLFFQKITFLYLSLQASLFLLFIFSSSALAPSLSLFVLHLQILGKISLSLTLFFFLFFSHTHTHLLLKISLSKSGNYGAFLFLFPHYFNFFHHLGIAYCK